MLNWCCCTVQISSLDMCFRMFTMNSFWTVSKKAVYSAHIFSMSSLFFRFFWIFYWLLLWETCMKFIQRNMPWWELLINAIPVGKKFWLGLLLSRSWFELLKYWVAFPSLVSQSVYFLILLCLWVFSPQVTLRYLWFFNILLLQNVPIDYFILKS